MRRTPVFVMGERRAQSAERRSAERRRLRSRVFPPSALSPLRSFLVLLALFVATSAFAQLSINNNNPVFIGGAPFSFGGTASPGATVTVTVENSGSETAVANDEGRWQIAWPRALDTGTYNVTAQSNGVTVTNLLRVQLRGTLSRQSGIEPPEPVYGTPEVTAEPGQEMTDRWRIAPPPYELDEKIRGRRIGTRGATLDPYNQNLLKGDLPIFGKDWFLVLTGISDSLVESRTLPTPSGVSSAEPGSFEFFGDDNQNLLNENVIVSADLFQGLTTFKPVTQRFKATVIGNLNYVRVQENAIVKPDVRRGTRRTDGQFSLQELFYERKLKDLSPNYDFLSIRVGSQPFSSDFRGFIFNDTNLGVRVFGNFDRNRFQYNLAVFDRLEKDTNSGLNRFERRGQQVAVANVYWQDFLRHGYTQQFSIHYLRDEASLTYDRNGVLVRPAPIGAFTPHDINATYLGEAGLGHIGRFNVDHAAYFVFGRDSLNPVAGPDPRLRDDDSVNVRAGMAAIEVSYDRDWLRPRFALFYATGDSNPRDRTATGFDSIFDSPNFAGGGFSFFNRLGIRLAGTGVALVERGSLLTSLRSSKDEGQPQYVNPGVQIASLGLDVDVTPRLKAIFTGNYIRLDKVEPVEELLFQGDISPELGIDLSAGVRWRPFLNQNVVVVGGAAAFLPRQGFTDIYERDKTLYHAFTNVILTF
jgi:hypothetical protein